MKNLICIVCPNGCHLKVDPDREYTISGNRCERGEAYAKAELTHPVRVVTSTVRLENAASRRLPVKTSAAVDKSKMFDVMALLNTLSVTAPVRTGDVLVKDILGSGADLIACKTVEGL